MAQNISKQDSKIKFKMKTEKKRERSIYTNTTHTHTILKSTLKDTRKKSKYRLYAIV